MPETPFPSAEGQQRPQGWETVQGTLWGGGRPPRGAPAWDKVTGAPSNRLRKSQLQAGLGLGGLMASGSYPKC